ncbi:MAG: MBL fold metallo-hydrolase, partial [Deltaproteobacteria bacterium]|nr:MBL fold metallo-hydrolase [Deltaproteobacteria bacterium]
MDERAAAGSAQVQQSEGDQLLAALGARRLALPIPFVQAGGPVNAYLIENADGSLTLFDTGLDTPECSEALLAGIAAGGRRVEEISRVLISHGHVDHWGLARMVQERSGARVYLHRDDWNKVVVGYEPDLADGHLERLGLAPELVRRITSMHSATEAFGRRLERVERLEPGTRFGFARFEGEVLHFPGHTPGLVCLHVPAHRLLFTDDHL